MFNARLIRAQAPTIRVRAHSWGPDLLRPGGRFRGISFLLPPLAAGSGGARTPPSGRAPVALMHRQE